MSLSLPSDSIIQLICISKGTGLGLIIKGGANRAEGPMVLIQEIVPGGDCQRDGRLQPGDQLVSINKESLIGVTYEEARSILTRTKLRWGIAFMRHRSSTSSASSSSGPQSPFIPQGADSGASSVPPTRRGTLAVLGALPPPRSLLQHRRTTLPAALPGAPLVVPKITSTLNPASETLPSVNLSQVWDFNAGTNAHTHIHTPTGFSVNMVIPPYGINSWCGGGMWCV
uniref:Syntaxin binding protein 4 n=1 Tax=Salmo trutta TaxID=8032 RepID=A0A674F354_SALTR